VRDVASFLISEGHHDAWHYPLGTLLYEAEIAAERRNQQLVTEMALMQMVVASALDPKAAKTLKKQLEKLSGNA
jgi:hypothetical protein